MTFQALCLTLFIMNKKDELVVYWAPTPFLENESSWNLLYHEPEPLFKYLLNYSDNPDALIFKCPATRNLSKNIFVVKSMIDNKFDMSADQLQSFEDNYPIGEPLPLDSKVSITKTRESNFKNHIDVNYNLAWSMFAEEPVIMRMTAPYMPSVTPVKNALLASGEFDIGRWFRPINLDYHFPIADSTFELNINDPIAFFEFQTDKKIVFKRFSQDSRIRELSVEMATAGLRYWDKMPILEKYKHAQQSGIRNLVLKYIKDNVVE